MRATSTTVIIVRQGDKTRMTPLPRTKAAAELIGQRRSEARVDLGPLFAKPSFLLEWADPMEAASLILGLSRR